MEAMVQAYWPIFLSSIFFVAWCVRLEAQVLHLKEARTEQKDAATARETALWAKLDTMNFTILELTRQVAKLEGVLQTRRDQSN